LKGSAVDAERSGGSRHVSTTVGEHTLNVLPLDSRQRGHGGLLVEMRATKRGHDLIGIGGFVR
jgi:hypothetical protein